MSNTQRDTLNDALQSVVSLSIDTDRALISIEVSAWLIGILLAILLLLILWFRLGKLKRYKLVKISVPLGNIGTAEFSPNEFDVQIAHKIWTELSTRKAAVKIDPENDVIIEVYNSWYALFSRVRELISEVPADLLRHERSTQELVRIATATLNEGLRPHLTKWQARFRNWYAANEGRLRELTPQELQREYPEYNELLEDMQRINEQLVTYADQLKKIVLG